VRLGAVHTLTHTSVDGCIDGLTFEVALVASVASESVVVDVVAFDAHHVLPALLAVTDVLLQVVVQLFERQLRRSARRVYTNQTILYRMYLAVADVYTAGSFTAALILAVLFAYPKFSGGFSAEKNSAANVGNWRRSELCLEVAVVRRDQSHVTDHVHLRYTRYVMSIYPQRNKCTA